MNFDIVVTSNTFSSNCAIYLLSKNFDINIAQIIPEITLIKDMPLFIPYATIKNLNIPYKIIENNFTTINQITFYLYNQPKIIKNSKKIAILTTLEKIRKFLQTNLKNPKKIKTLQSSIKEIHFKDSKIFLRLSNNKLLSTQYLLIGDDFWGNSWNLLNYKPHHSGGWIIKTPTNNIPNIQSFLAFGFSKYGVILGNQEYILFSKHIDKQYSIDDLITNFLLNNKIINEIFIKDWNKFVLPFSTEPFGLKDNIKNQKIFFISEYLGLVSPLIPEYTYLVSLLVKETVDNIDNKVKTFEHFLPLLNKIVEYNQIFFKIAKFINSFPLMFLKNDQKDEILSNFFYGLTDPKTMDNQLKEIFENYDFSKEIVLSPQALEEE